ncbi:MAG: 1-acyl-sn-glycerol-3-phosphate acyltransferase [Gemmobacter sp.]
MFRTVELPLWLLLLILGFAAVTFASHFLFPSVRWFFRRRMERAVAELNKRLQRPVEPFKLLERHDRILRLVYDPQVIAAAVAHARSTGVPEAVAFEKARRYAGEIVPGFSASIYFGFAVRAARWLSQTLYDVKVSARDEAALRDIAPDATVVFVMNHRSNMDYVLVTWLVSSRMTLSYAVGEWARVWPLSRLIRAMGAYFIRRKNLNPLYRTVMERYVRMATAEGVSQAIFPEGGLSLDGRVGPAKLGLLGFILAEARESGRDVAFVPVAFAYDRVLEDRVLTEAAENGVRRFRARPAAIAGFVLRMVWRKLRGRYRGFGTVGVSFGLPLSLQRMLDAEPALTPEALADRLMAGVRAVVPVLPVPLVAAALIRDGAVPKEALAGHVAALRASLADRDAVLLAPEGSECMALTPLVARGIVVDTPEGLRPAAGAERLLAFHAAPVLQIVDAAAASASPQTS